ncbi:MAG: outer spore coat protein CotE [Faecalibacillus sp.]
MAGQLFEIITKATICKGCKKTIDKYEFTLEEIDKILGCWICNHRYQGIIKNGKTIIEGDFDIHLWYSYQNDSFLSKQQIHYTDTIELSKKDRELTDRDEIIAECIHLPKCIDAKLSNKTMQIQIEKEMSLKIVGDTTILVESKIDQEDKELDINPDFIT